MHQYYPQIYEESRQTATESPFFLRLEQIRVSNLKHSDQTPNAIIRLAESVKRYGILEPISVRISGEEHGNPLYEVVDGARRLRAARIAGMAKIPCILLPMDDRACAIAGILGNLQGGGLHIFEQAAAFRLLMTDFSLTQEEIARKLGLSQSAIANKLRLLRLSREEQHLILEYKLTERHARAILRLKSPEKRAEAIYRIHAGHLNVASAEKLVEELLEQKGNVSQSRAVSQEISSAEPSQSPFTGTKNASRTPLKPSTVVLSPERPPSGVLPRKFAIPDLTPLYNSIERTLSIFRKTGATASCIREEGEEGVRIVIEIPKNA
ncbi:MAG: ParB/RepB/Spo0J family partition protein [Clostridia bacterium]|nr:ParB/RepB/Spo0J family partition protein [Clostridia bacterium]